MKKIQVSCKPMAIDIFSGLIMKFAFGTKNMMLQEKMTMMLSLIDRWKEKGHVFT